MNEKSDRNFDIYDRFEDNEDYRQEQIIQRDSEYVDRGTHLNPVRPSITGAMVAFATTLKRLK